MYGLVIFMGFITAIIGLGCMLANLSLNSYREVPALWAIVAALGVLQICLGAIGSTLASLVQKKLPCPDQQHSRLAVAKGTPPPIPQTDEPLEADLDLFDKPGDRGNISG